MGMPGDVEQSTLGTAYHITFRHTEKIDTMSNINTRVFARWTMMGASLYHTTTSNVAVPIRNKCREARSEPKLARSASGCSARIASL